MGRQQHTAQYERYLAYKDSGVKWLGEIPEEWELCPLGALLLERNEKNVGNLERNILSVMKDVGVIRYADKGNVGNKSSDRPEHYKVVYPGDIVANSMNLVIGSVGIATEKGVTSSVYLIYRPASEKVDINFYHYMFKTAGFQKAIGSHGKGILELREAVKHKDMKLQYVPYPRRADQRTVVAFLDAKTAQIDSVIAKKQKLIDLLKEKRQALITHAVTKGLDPHAKMKDSGVEWIREVPEHWAMRKLGTLGAFFKGRGVAKTDITDTGVPAIIYGDIYMRYGVEAKSLTRYTSAQAAANAQEIQSGDLLFTASGETVEDIGKTTLYSGDVPGYAGGDLIILRQVEAVGLFLSYVLNSALGAHQRSAFGRGDIIVHISTSKLKQIVAPLPPGPEQQAIAAFLDRKTAHIDEAMAKTKTQIEKLQEYRAALIYNAVTGKINVQEYAH